MGLQGGMFPLTLYAKAGVLKTGGLWAQGHVFTWTHTEVGAAGTLSRSFQLRGLDVDQLVFPDLPTDVPSAAPGPLPAR